MPKIVLTQPFIHHYKGSVFELAESTYYSNWDEDERLRDRIHFYDKKVFDLPDDGRGRAVQLPVHMTKPCPDRVFKEIDIKSGPCRITYVSKGLENKDDPYYAYPSPEGKGKILLRDRGMYKKNIIHIDLENIEIPGNSVILNLISGTKKQEDFGKDFVLDFTFFDPGFYQIDLIKEDIIIHQFNMIKCFPLVVTFHEGEDVISTTTTIW